VSKHHGVIVNYNTKSNASCFLNYFLIQATARYSAYKSIAYIAGKTYLGRTKLIHVAGLAGCGSPGVPSASVVGGKEARKNSHVIDWKN
jgi:hypothetical protein